MPNASSSVLDTVISLGRAHNIINALQFITRRDCLLLFALSVHAMHVLKICSVLDASNSFPTHIGISIDKYARHPELDTLSSLPSYTVLMHRELGATAIAHIYNAARRRLLEEFRRAAL